MNGHLQHKTSALQFKRLFCQAMAVTGFCARGSACTFAHSEMELEWIFWMEAEYRYIKAKIQDFDMKFSRMVEWQNLQASCNDALVGENKKLQCQYTKLEQEVAELKKRIDSVTSPSEDQSQGPEVDNRQMKAKIQDLDMKFSQMLEQQNIQQNVSTADNHKTVMCKYVGHCTWGLNCRFAHSELELRQATEAKVSTIEQEVGGEINKRLNNLEENEEGSREELRREESWNNALVWENKKLQCQNTQLEREVAELKRRIDRVKSHPEDQSQGTIAAGLVTIAFCLTVGQKRPLAQQVLSLRRLLSLLISNSCNSCLGSSIL